MSAPSVSNTILPANLHNLFNTKTRSKPDLHPANPANHPTYRAPTHAAGRGKVLSEQADDQGLVGGASELLPRAQVVGLTGTRCMLPGRGSGLGARYVVGMGFAVLVTMIGLVWLGILGSMVIWRVGWGRIRRIDSFEIFGLLCAAWREVRKRGKRRRTEVEESGA